MCPYLKEIRKLIKDIKSINPDVFPIEICEGIYAKPNSFSKTIRWNYIQKSDIGYLTTHRDHSEMTDLNRNEFCGCPLSQFNNIVKHIVRTILKSILDNMMEGENNESKEIKN